MSRCDLDLTFDLAVMTLIIKIFSGPYLVYCKLILVRDIKCGCAVSQCDLVVTFDLVSARLFSTATFETYFSCHKDI